MALRSRKVSGALEKRALDCYTSQLKYVFRSKEKVSRVVNQISLTPYENDNLNFLLARDQAVLLETASNLCAIERQTNDFSEFCFLFVLVGMYNKTLC